MLCIFFKTRTGCPLRHCMKKLMDIHDDPQKNKIIRKNALLYLIIIVKAISYAASCPRNKFTFIKGNNKAFWSTRNFKIIDPNTNKVLVANDIKLIKNIGKDNHPNIKKAPIFEIRVNRIEDLDIGFRCIFFVTHEYECYVYPFKKDKYYGHHNKRDDYKAQQQGKYKTDNAVRTTFNIYKAYRLNPKEFSSLFNYNNLISNFLMRGGKNEKSH